MRKWLQNLSARNILFQGTVVDVGTQKNLTEGLFREIPLLSEAIRSGDMTKFLNIVFVVTISAGAVFAVIRIAYAGFRYMTTDAFTEKSASKTIIRDAVFGLVLLLAIVLILRSINPQLLEIKLFLPTGSSSSPSLDEKNRFMGRPLP